MAVTANQVLDHIHTHPDRVVEICRQLVQFDTVFLGPGAGPRQDKQCQEWIAGFLRDLGFEVDQWEPDPAEMRDHPRYQEGLNWKDRPITVGVLRGSGGGRSLILNGHLDTVSAEPVSEWEHNPWGADIVGDRLYGRGSSDMKGGIAANLAVAEAVARAGGLKGDLIVEVVSDEETSGLGTIAAIRRGYTADACLVPEPSSFETWVAYRGIMFGEIRTEGRPAHAEIPQPHWRAGGGVSAIDAMRKVLDGIDVLNEDWRDRPDQRHPLLGTPSVIPTIIRGGEFIASIPGQCEVELDVTYLPSNADEGGFGSKVRAEIERQIDATAQADPWLNEHPPQVSWTEDFPAAEMDPNHPFVHAVVAAAAEEGIESPIAGLNSWADAASYSREGVPSACFGPGDIMRAHTIDEWVSIEELRACARVIARLTAEWCGKAG